MNTVKLKHGPEEDARFVSAVMLSLEKVLRERPIHAYELACLARDQTHQLFGNAGIELEKLGLVQATATGGFTMHGSIRNIVLSAAQGDGLDMSFGSPLA